MWKYLNFKDIISKTNVYYFLENYLDGFKKIIIIHGVILF